MQPRRVLITGASGLLGINLALEIAKKHPVIGVVGTQAIQTSAFQVVKADLLASGAVERIIEETQPNWVIHCAALANVDACEAEPTLAYQLNSEIPYRLAKYVARGGARLIHVSTDAVFDGRRGQYREEDTPNPLSVYAKSKLAGESSVSVANPDAIIARVNLFGWSINGRRSLAEFFYHNLSSGNKIMGFTDVFFCPILANDLAGIFMKMLEIELHGLYHVVSGDCMSKYEFGLQLAKRFGLKHDLIKPTSVNEAGLTAARSPNLTLSAEKLETAIGNPLPFINQGLDHFYALYRKNYPQKLKELQG